MSVIQAMDRNIVVSAGIFFLFLMAENRTNEISATEDRLYQLYKTNMTWSEAQAFCRKFEADLATVNSMGDHKRLVESIGNADVKDAWIGLTKSSTDQFVWSDGIGKDKMYDYNPVEEDGDCVWMKPAGYWAVDDCNAQHSFICMRHSSTGEKEYIIYPNSKSWRDALNVCRTRYTDLATVETAAQHSRSAGLQEQYSQDKSWVGLFRDSWKWSDESDSSFRNWYQTKPENYGGTQNCVMTTKALQHQWDDDDCDNRRPFICNFDPKLKKRIFVVGVKLSSDVNLNLPAERDSLLQQMQSRLERKGLTDVKISWRADKNEQIFQCKRDKKDGGTETGC